MKLRTSEVEQLQKEWGNKPCNHDEGYGIEIEDEYYGANDYFCLKCGMRHSNPKFFEEKKKK